MSYCNQSLTFSACSSIAISCYPDILAPDTVFHSYVNEGIRLIA
uniref:Uncharacterized protein n=1 Tax=Anguilla anguilla TaxID=7936 RepID=A0A0E9VGR7_ANGAN